MLANNNEPSPESQAGTVTPEANDKSVTIDDDDGETMNPENLLLEKVELDYMKELAALISRSPRAVKRFVSLPPDACRRAA